MRFKDLMESSQLNEAVNYESLFDPVINLYKKFQDDRELAEWGDLAWLQGQIKDRIKYIKSSISQGRPGFQNWIIYVLKIERMRLILTILDNIDPQFDPSIYKKLEKYFDYGITTSDNNSMTQYRTATLYRMTNDLTRQFEHFSAYDYEPIKRYNPTDQMNKVISDLQSLEREYFDKMGEDDRLLQLEDGDSIMKDFGDGMVWVKLSRGACQAEGDQMGHCGNVPSVQSGDRILSLRKKRPRGNEMFYEPFATFIYNENTKQLGERKGRQNEKPVEKYYPYIVWLLKQPYIEGMNNDGYAPEDNFQLSDLDDKTRKEVIEANPNLMFITGTPLNEFDPEKLKEFYSKYKATISEDGAFNSYNEIYYNVDTGKVILPLDIELVVDDHLMNVINDIQSYWYNDSSPDIDNVVSDLNEPNMKTLYDFCAKIAENYDLEDFPEFEEFKKEADRGRFTGIFDEYDSYDEIEDDSDWDEMKSFFDRIYDYALMNSYETEIRNAIIKRIDGIKVESYEPEVEFYFDGKFGTKAEGFQQYLDEASTVIFATNTFVHPDDSDVIMEQIREEDITISDIDDRYLSYYASSETINSMFADYWEFD